MNPPAIDPRLLALDRARTTASQTSRAVSVPVGTRVAWPSGRATSSPPPHSSSEWGSSSSDILEALQLRIEQLESLSDDQDAKVARLEEAVAVLKRRVEDAGLDADADADADDEGQQQKKKKKKKKGSAACERILTKQKQTELTEKERRVRKELLNLVGNELKALSGTPVDSPTPSDNLPPGEHVLPDGRHLLVPDFRKDVTDHNNDRLIEQAAHLIFTQKLGSISHKDVAFTERDVQFIAKTAFRNWKVTYIRENDDAAREKAASQLKKGTRNQRKRQKKNDRLETREEYLVQYGADPTPLLLTDWMSEYVSELDEGNDHEKGIHRLKVRAAAGLTLQHQEDEEIIWERIRPAFRSESVNAIYQKLDELRKASKRDAGKKNASNKRIDIGRVNNRIPNVPPYPFMVDEDWRKAFVDGKTLDEPFETKRDDPAGFGSKEQEITD